jgi:hypothetical protein
MIGPTPARSTARPLAFMHTSMVPCYMPKTNKATSRLAKSHDEAMMGSIAPQASVVTRRDDVSPEAPTQPTADGHRQHSTNACCPQQRKAEGRLIEMTLSLDRWDPRRPGAKRDAVEEEGARDGSGTQAQARLDDGSGG